MYEFDSDRRTSVFLSENVDISMFIKSHVDKNNLAIYEILAQSMSLQNMITAARNSKQTKFLETVRSELWQLAMESTELETFQFPERVPPDIIKHVILRNCKQKASFLEKITPIELTQMIDNKNLLNLEKNELCSVVSDMNALSHIDIEHTIKKCNVSINQIDKRNIDDTIREDLRVKFLKFSIAAANWKDSTKYTDYCNPQNNTNCGTRIKQLRVISNDVTTHADTCMKTIDALVKKGLVNRRTKGEKLNLKDTIGSYW